MRPGVRTCVRGTVSRTLVVNVGCGGSLHVRTVLVRAPVCDRRGAGGALGASRHLPFEPGASGSVRLPRARGGQARTLSSEVRCARACSRRAAPRSAQTSGRVNVVEPPGVSCEGPCECRALCAAGCCSAVPWGWVGPRATGRLANVRTDFRIVFERGAVVPTCLLRHIDTGPHGAGEEGEAIVPPPFRRVFCETCRDRPSDLWKAVPVARQPAQPRPPLQKRSALVVCSLRKLCRASAFAAEVSAERWLGQVQIQGRHGRGGAGPRTVFECMLVLIWCCAYFVHWLCFRSASLFTFGVAPRAVRRTPSAAPS